MDHTTEALLLALRSRVEDLENLSEAIIRLTLTPNYEDDLQDSCDRKLLTDWLIER